VILVPAKATASAANFTAAVTGTIHAAITQHAAVVSISGSRGEHLFTPAQVARLHAALRQAADRHVTVVASSGDTGVISDNGPRCRSACREPAVSSRFVANPQEQRPAITHTL
jgi:methylmalonyl-CoA mutase cobalamin-binding subunit